MDKVIIQSLMRIKVNCMPAAIGFFGKNKNKNNYLMFTSGLSLYSDIKEE